MTARGDAERLERLVDIAMDVCHHDASPDDPATEYERNCLRRRFTAELDRRPAPAPATPFTDGYYARRIERGDRPDSPAAEPPDKVERCAQIAERHANDAAMRPGLYRSPEEMAARIAADIRGLAALPVEPEESMPASGKEGK